MRRRMVALIRRGTATALATVVLAAVAAIIAGSGGGVSAQSSSVTTSSTSSGGGCSFGADTVNLLAFSVGPSSVQSAVQSWSNSTGIPVRLDLVGPTLQDLYTNANSDLRTGSRVYDAYMTLPMWMTGWVADGLLVDVSDGVRNSYDLHWSDLLPVFRDRIATYQSRVYAVPVDGDEYLLYYRADLLAADGRSVPRTWDEYLATAAFYHGKDLNGDGVPDVGTCWCNDNSVYGYWQLWSVLSPMLQTQGTSQGVFFDLTSTGLRVQWHTAAMRRALELVDAIASYGPSRNASNGFPSQHALFRDGGCALYISFPSAGTQATQCVPLNASVPCEGANAGHPYVWGRMGVDVLPGSSTVWDRATDTLVPCSGSGASSSSNCPHAVNGVNVAPFQANSGLCVVFNAQSSPDKQAAAFSLAATISAQVNVAALNSPYNPFRQSQFRDTTLFAEAGWNAQDAVAYTTAIGATQAHPNGVLELRIPQSTPLSALFGSVLQQFLARNLTLDDALQRLQTGADAILSPDAQRQLAEQVYRASLGLPQRTAAAYVQSDAVAFLFPALAIVGMVACACLALGVIRFRAKPVFKASSWTFCVIVLCGLLLSYALVPLLNAYPPTSAVCSAAPFVGHLAFALVFGSLFAKTYRLTQIFDQKSLRAIYIRDTHLALAVGSLCAFVAVYVGLWTVIDPQLPTEIETGGYAFVVCASSSGVPSALLFCLEGAILLYGIVCAVKTRDIPVLFNESRQIAMAIYTLALIAAVFLPLVSSVLADPTAILVFKSLGIMLISTPILVVIFAPKFYETYINRNKSSTHSDTLGSAAPPGSAGASGGVAAHRVSHSREHSVSRIRQAANAAGLNTTGLGSGAGGSAGDSAKPTKSGEAAATAAGGAAGDQQQQQVLAARDRRIKQLEDTVARLTGELAAYKEQAPSLSARGAGLSVSSNAAPGLLGSGGAGDSPAAGAASGAAALSGVPVVSLAPSGVGSAPESPALPAAAVGSGSGSDVAMVTLNIASDVAPPPPPPPANAAE